MFAIVHILESLGIGGAQSMAFELYHAIKTYYPQYPQQMIYTQKRRIDQEFISSYNVPCEFIKNNNSILQQISKHKKVVVLFHKLASSNHKILDLIKDKTRAKTMVINHTLYRSSAWKNVKSADVMVSVSKHMLQLLNKWYPRINKIQIYNSVSVDRYDSISPRKNNKKDIFLTGRINRICSWKHSHGWIEWCKNVKLKKKMIHEYIGGGIGSNNRSHKKMYKSRNVVSMMGNISNFSEKVSIIKDWDIFLYETNKDEGISMAILESLACGVPVVCSNHFGNKEIIEEGINGYVFRDRNHAQDILRDLIKHPKKLEELKRTTKQHFIDKLDLKYTSGQYIEEMEKLFKKEIKKKPTKKVLKTKKIPKKKKKPVKQSLREKINNVAETQPNNKFTIITSIYNK
ncbi:unnamed protein product, partial [marine sediment metagenome]